MSLTEEITWLVRDRAGRRCEYCQMHQALQGATFHVEHIQPKVRGGTNRLENLAWCCPSCNLHKADRTEVPDPDSAATVLLFNPRMASWTDHFHWEGYRLVGITAIGRATVFALGLNHPRRLLIREAEAIFGLFPP